MTVARRFRGVRCNRMARTPRYSVRRDPGAGGRGRRTGRMTAVEWSPMLVSTVLDGSNVVTATWAGALSADEVRVLCAQLDVVAAQYGGARVLLELADVAHVEPAAAWEDLKTIEAVADLERMALVTDARWAEIVADVDNTVVPAEIAVFEAAQRERALAWVSAR
jgi:hypothetical protein